MGNTACRSHWKLQFKDFIIQTWNLVTSMNNYAGAKCQLADHNHLQKKERKNILKIMLIDLVCCLLMLNYCCVVNPLVDLD